MSGTRPPEHRGCDLDNAEEVSEFVTRFNREIAQDPRFHLYFDTIANVDWHAHTLTLTDFWAGLLFGPPVDDADTVIEKHRWLHEAAPFDAGLFDRWLEILDDTLDGGWTGTATERARSRGRGLAWAMSHRFIGAGTGRRRGGG